MSQREARFCYRQDAGHEREEVSSEEIEEDLSWERVEVVCHPPGKTLGKESRVGVTEERDEKCDKTASPCQHGEVVIRVNSGTTGLSPSYIINL